MGSASWFIPIIFLTVYCLMCKLTPLYAKL